LQEVLGRLLTGFIHSQCGNEPSGSGREHHLADPAVSSILTAGLPSRVMTVPVTDAVHLTPPDRPQWVDDGLLRCTIERQLSRKPMFLPGAASGAIGHHLLFPKHRPGDRQQYAA